jgi:hypothetical protein
METLILYPLNSMKELLCEEKKNGKKERGSKVEEKEYAKAQKERG